MLGSLIERAREEKNVSKTELAKMTGINVGHLTHIEKGERNPSQKALKSICESLEIPFEPLYYSYEKGLSEEQKQFNLINNISYSRIPLISGFDDFVECPARISCASLAFKMPDDSMKGSLPRDTLVYLEFNTIPENKEFGLFRYNGTIFVRRLIFKKNKVILKSDNLLCRDYSVSEDDDFQIIGKVIQ